MKKRILFLFIFMSTQCCGMTWHETIDTYRTVVSDNSIVLKQYRAFVVSHAPTIADSRIKEIPIHECGEQLVDLRRIRCHRIQMLPDPAAPFEAAWCNSGLPHASKMRSSIYTKLQKMTTALDELASFFGYESGQVDIKIFEALRDLETQKMLFDKKVSELVHSNPDLSVEEAEREAAKWVSPYKNNVPVHSTGAAVDIRLWDNKRGCFLDMGAFGVIWGTNTSAPSFSENLTDEQKRNRLYCFVAAERAELTNYVYEFWHFSSGDRYDAFWKNQTQSQKGAIYGPIA
jgi:D-alanyl-D-alanine dipeptidase